MVRQGAWLFRWRSYLPLVLLPVAISVFQNSGWMTQLFGETVEESYDYLCLVTAFAGLAIRIGTVGFVPAGTSGRNHECAERRGSQYHRLLFADEASALFCEFDYRNVDVAEGQIDLTTAVDVAYQRFT